jgi:hypothetical protein
MTEGLDRMLLIGFISLFLLLALIPMYESEKTQYVRPFLYGWFVWEILWLGPPLFHIWVSGVMG